MDRFIRDNIHVNVEMNLSHFKLFNLIYEVMKYFPMDKVLNICDNIPSLEYVKNIYYNNYLSTIQNHISHMTTGETFHYAQSLLEIKYYYHINILKIILNKYILIHKSHIIGLLSMRYGLVKHILNNFQYHNDFYTHITLYYHMCACGCGYRWRIKKIIAELYKIVNMRDLAKYFHCTVGYSYSKINRHKIIDIHITYTRLLEHFPKKLIICILDNNGYYINHHWTFTSLLNNDRDEINEYIISNILSDKRIMELLKLNHAPMLLLKRIKPVLDNKINSMN